MSFVHDLYVNNDLYVTRNAVINGDLRVNGTTTNVDTVNLNVKDSHIYLNKDYTDTVLHKGGIVLNTNSVIANITDTTSQITAPSTITTVGSGTFNAGQKIIISGTTSNNGTYTVVSHTTTALVIVEATLTTETVAGTISLISDSVAAGGFTAATTVVTSGTASFSTNDLIQISTTSNTFSGNESNIGIYQVASHVGTVLTISTASDFAQNTFTATTTFPETNDVNLLIITKVDVSLIQLNTAGIWQTTSGSTSTAVAANLKTILLSGTAALETNITLTDTTNQILLSHTGGTTNVTTLNIADPAQTSVYTVPDSGATANFIMSEGAQTLNGVYTIGSSTGSLILQDSNQTHAYTIAAGNLTANSTYTLPSLDGAHTFVCSNDTSGQILVADGLVGTPAYAFTSDPNTGMFVDGNSLNFAYNGSSIFEVNASGIVINGSIKPTGTILESVKAWAGAGPHAMTISGVGSERVQYVTHTAAATINLPDVITGGVANDGLKFTIVNLLTADFTLTIGTADASTIDNEVLTTIGLVRRNQRFTLQWLNATSCWYIV